MLTAKAVEDDAEFDLMDDIIRAAVMWYLELGALWQDAKQEKAIGGLVKSCAGLL